MLTQNELIAVLKDDPSTKILVEAVGELDYDLIYKVYELGYSQGYDDGSEDGYWIGYDSSTENQ